MSPSRIAPLLLTLFLAAPAFAQSTWTMTSGCSQNSAYSGTFGNSYACNAVTSPGNSVAGSSLNVSAWSTDTGANTWESDGNSTYNGGGSTNRTNLKTIFTKNASNTYDWVTYSKSTGGIVAKSSDAGQAPVTALPTTASTNVKSRSQGAPSNAGQWFANGQVGDYGGNGFGDTSRVEYQQSPNHAIDSTSPGITDLVLLTFDRAVILEQLGIGWSGGDSDITLLRWAGTTAPQTLSSATAPAMGSSAALDGTKKTASNSGGWELVSSFNVGSGDVGTHFNTTATLASSWWLVSTFNTTLFGSSTCLNPNGTTSATGCDLGDDAFKLSFLKTSNYACTGTLGAGGVCTPPSSGGGSTPEPGSLVLAALAGVVLWSRRRDRGAVVA